MIDWVHAGPSVLAAFLASLVEFVEALTVVLAVGTIRGWRPALAGAGLALVTLTILVIALGPPLVRIPLATVQLVVGTLLLLFGLRWLRKAILRAAGIIAPHDETAAYAAEADLLSHSPRRLLAGWDTVAVTASFKIVMLEGIEVVFIVIAIGAFSGLLVPAGVGAAGALLLVVALGVALHRPLARIPENMLKFLVGVLLSAFGAFWVGEGAGLDWPGADWSILALIAAFLALALSMIPLCRGRRINVDQLT
ncbi:MAG: COG4280 domain-containing protein [Dongiaceae bacterium]